MKRKPLVALIVVVALGAAFLAVIGLRHARRVHRVRAAVSQAVVDLAAEAREHSKIHPELPARIDSLTRDRPRAGGVIRRLRDNLGRDIALGFTPPGASRAGWLSLAVSRRGVVLLEVERDGSLRLYEPRLPSRSMGCHCLR